jgi:hypothetical protein
MFRFKILAIIFLFTFNLPFAQTTKNKIKIHKVWVSKIDNSKTIKGILIQANEESLKVLGRREREILVDIRQIDKIKIRRKGKVGNGILVGATTGFVAGGLIGLISGDEPDETVDGGWLFGTYTAHGTSAESKAYLWGFSLAVAGSGVGAIIGSKKVKIEIKGDLRNYNKYMELLRGYSNNPN